MLCRNRLDGCAAVGSIDDHTLLVAQLLLDHTPAFIERPGVGSDDAADDRFAQPPGSVDYACGYDYR